MSSKRAFWKWSAIGLVTALLLVWAQSRAVDGVAGMLQVGETSALRPVIEQQLGNVPLVAGPGHDGQIYYSIGLDLDGSQVGPLLDHAGYRYRRILLPLLASLFGTIDGWGLLWGQVLVCVISMAVACGLAGALIHRSGRNELLTLAVVLNPGMWLSVQFLTADVLSVALMVGALYGLVFGRTRSGSALFSLSVLAKDVSLATPVPLGAKRGVRGLAAIPTVALLAWMIVLTVRFGNGFAPRGNLDWPLAGITAATSNWGAFDAREWLYLVFAIGSVCAGLVFSFRRSWLRWPIAAWSALALISSNWVWDFGNNAARAFAPIVVLIALSFAHVPDNALSTDREAAAG